MQKDRTMAVMYGIAACTLGCIGLLGALIWRGTIQSTENTAGTVGASALSGILAFVSVVIFVLGLSLLLVSFLRKRHESEHTNMPAGITDGTPDESVVPLHDQATVTPPGERPQN